MGIAEWVVERLRQHAKDHLHFWPFDGWVVPHIVPLSPYVINFANAQRNQETTLPMQPREGHSPLPSHQDQK